MDLRPTATEVGRWIRWGDADYLAARLLFLINLIVQATALSTTAIEKYLKAVCCFYSIKVPKEVRATTLTHLFRDQSVCENEYPSSQRRLFTAC